MTKAQTNLFPLSAEEYKSRTEELARIVHREIPELEAEKEKVDKEYKAKRKALDEKVERLAKELDECAVEREIQPTLPKNGKKGKKAEEVGEAEAKAEAGA